MTLLTNYKQFLADPKSTPLAPNASLIYITTAAKFDQPDAILTHLSKQEKIVKKKGVDTILDAIEAPGSLFVDVETTLEFVTGGGAYLPTLDSEFIADHVVTFPMVLTAAPSFFFLFLCFCPLS